MAASGTSNVWDVDQIQEGHATVEAVAAFLVVRGCKTMRSRSMRAAAAFFRMEMSIASRTRPKEQVHDNRTQVLGGGGFHDDEDHLEGRGFHVLGGADRGRSWLLHSLLSNLTDSDEFRVSNFVDELFFILYGHTSSAVS